MKKVDIKNMSADDLKNQLKEVQAQYSRMKLAHKISPIENPIQIRELRKTIARINTEMSIKANQQ